MPPHLKKALAGGYAPDSLAIAQNIVGMRSSKNYKLVDINGNSVLPKEPGLGYMDFLGGLVLKIKLDLSNPQNGIVIPLSFYNAKGHIDKTGNKILSTKATYKNGESIDCAYGFGSSEPTQAKTVIRIDLDPYSRTAIMQTTDKKFGLSNLVVGLVVISFAIMGIIIIVIFTSEAKKHSDKAFRSKKTPLQK